MAAYYLDTSAIVKYYARETGTAWITRLVDPAAGHILYTVSLTGAELVAAMARKGRTGEVAPVAAQRAIASIRADWPAWARVITVRPEIVERAMDLIERHGLRGYDAVHLAAALAVRSLASGAVGTPIFVSVDDSQRRSAAAEGLTVDDPNVHP